MSLGFLDKFYKDLKDSHYTIYQHRVSLDMEGGSGVRELEKESYQRMTNHYIESSLFDGSRSHGSLWRYKILSLNAIIDQEYSYDNMREREEGGAREGGGWRE